MRYAYCSYLSPECSFSLRPFSSSDKATVFRVDKHMFRMVLSVAEPVWRFSSFAYVYAFELYDSFCNTHQGRPYSSVPMNLIHCLTQNILQDKNKYLYLWFFSFFYHTAYVNIILFLKEKNRF